MSSYPRGWSPTLLAILSRISWYSRVILAPLSNRNGRSAAALDRLFRQIQLVITTPDGIRVSFRPFLKGDLPQVMTMFRPVKHHIAVGLSEHWTSGIIVEAGAHIGAYALRAAQYLGANGRVVAIEPDPETFAILQKNISLNNYQNVTAIQVSLSDQNSETKLYQGDGSVGNTIIDARPHIGTWVIVPTIRLDTLLEKLQLESPNFIRMNIEGAELLALQGCTRLLSSANKLRLLIGFSPVRAAQADIDFPIIERFLSDGFDVSRKGHRLVAVRRNTRLIAQVP